MASSGTNVVSNKTENEDDICDNWEQLNYCDLEKRLQTIKLENNEEKNIKNNKNMNTVNNTNQQQQPIKILKRPPSNKQLNNLTQNPVNTTPAQPIKTFEQREQEYAQARLRILGSAHPQEESNTKQAATTQSSSNQDNITNSNSKSPVKPNQQTNKNNIYLIREPLCPDGTKGFSTSNVQDNSMCHKN